jgi:26S proteasome regulatory subunit T5
MDPVESGEEDGANVDLDAQRKGKCAVIKTSTRHVQYSTSYKSTPLKKK